MIESELVTILLADPGVSALVGTSVFPVVIRESATLPAITYQRLSGERTYTLGGASGWATVHVGITGWANGYAAARALADAVRVALDAYTGTGGGDIQVATVADGADTYLADVDLFGCTLDVTVQYQEV